MTERQILLKKISTLAFAVLDLHLFLDTHPDDEQTRLKLRQYESELMPLRQKYEREYGKLSWGEEGDGRLSWIQNPWPWEREDNA